MAPDVRLLPAYDFDTLPGALPCFRHNLLAQLLALANDPARDALNKGIYLRTNAVDAGGSFVGADAAASWWHRNFRMYANIQKAAARDHRVLVVAGQGHTAVLKDLLAADDQRHARDVRAYID